MDREDIAGLQLKKRYLRGYRDKTERDRSSLGVRRWEMGLRKVTEGEIGVLGASAYGVFQCMEYIYTYMYIYIHTSYTFSIALYSIIQFSSIFMTRWEATSHSLAPGLLPGYGSMLLSAGGTQHLCIHPGTITEIS